MKKFLFAFFVISFILIARGNSTLITTKSGCGGDPQAATMPGGGSPGEVSKLAWDLGHKLVRTEMESETEVKNLTKAFDDLADVKATTELELMQEIAELREQVKKLETKKADDEHVLISMEKYRHISAMACFYDAEVWYQRDPRECVDVYNDPASWLGK